MQAVTSYLVSGDPFNPCDTDLVAQTALVDVRAAVPDGWSVLSGNFSTSIVGRLVYRYEAKRAALPFQDD